jgi:hypothetical protein
MDDRIRRAENPLIAASAFDPHSGFVASHKLRAAQRHLSGVSTGGEDRRGAFEHIRRRGLPDFKPEQVANDTLQPAAPEEYPHTKSDCSRK